MKEKNMRYVLNQDAGTVADFRINEVKSTLSGIVQLG